MPRTALKCNVELKLQAITCPGVWLPNKDDVYVSVCLLGQHRRTPLVSSVFPLLFHTEMNFSKVFWSAVDPTDVVDRLEGEHIYLELVQMDLPSSGTVLARYEDNLRDFLFPYPRVAPKVLNDRDVLMEKTVDFPNGISPRLEFSCTTTIRETPTPYTDAYESAITGMDDIRIRVPRSRLARHERLRASSPPPCDRDHYGRTHHPTHDFTPVEYTDDEPKRPFVVRRVDKSLIHRVPGSSAPEPFPTSVNVEYNPRARSLSRRSRSRTASRRARSASPVRTKVTRGLFGVYETDGRKSVEPKVYREPRRYYIDNDEYETDDDILVNSRYRYRPRSPSPPSYYERLRKQIEEENLAKRIEQRVKEALDQNRSPSYYSSALDRYGLRSRYPYTSDSLDRLADDLERARIRRYYP